MLSRNKDDFEFFKEDSIGKTGKRSKSTAIPKKSRTTYRPFWKHKILSTANARKTLLINSKSQAKYYYFVRLRKDVSIKAFHRISFFKSKNPYQHIHDKPCNSKQQHFALTKWQNTATLHLFELKIRYENINLSKQQMPFSSRKSKGVAALLIIFTYIISAQHMLQSSDDNHKTSLITDC